MINNVILQGRLTDDPELKQTPSGDFVCSVIVASGRKYSKNQDNDKADFIRCEAWGNTAVFMSKYLRKGTMIDIMGNIRTNKWLDENQKNRYETYVHINNVTFSATNSRKPEQTEPSEPQN